ncbi:endonuclease III [Clostridium acetireducens DSM 10703]|jgi:endonuclease-3|uniref:Endonuclease III n=1 Tax=Clostridium acetireducens DSM 10703 TaxID=1121290 RepID=A0A1E8EWR4_9CLOT|nr:endonuclease III [Clostridium acetireducens]OFI05075.1 endonuclease III [Clostridium acetireducens DSM 10703]
MNKNKVDEILKILEKNYPEAKCALKFETPYQLLVSTILSAQCTDVRVNAVTEELYKKYDNPQKILTLSTEELGEKIKSCGLYKNKSKNILSATEKILKDYNGEVPKTREELLKLPGVGRKTANVVLSNAYGIPAIAVDTHVFRVSNRIGIGIGKNPDQVEKSLMENIQKSMWSKAHHYLIWHGRLICKARNPKCSECALNKYCNYYNEVENNKIKTSKKGEK